MELIEALTLLAANHPKRDDPLPSEARRAAQRAVDLEADSILERAVARLKAGGDA